MANSIPKAVTRLKGAHKIVTWLHAWQIRRKARKDIKSIKKLLK
ncbi:hypothetical protein [Marinicellulosiphila megalodicopiae]